MSQRKNMSSFLDRFRSLIPSDTKLVIFCTILDEPLVFSPKTEMTDELLDKIAATISEEDRISYDPTFYVQTFNAENIANYMYLYSAVMDGHAMKIEDRLQGCSEGEAWEFWCLS